MNASTTRSGWWAQLSRITSRGRAGEGRSFLVLAFFSGLSSFLSFVTGVLIARRLGVEDFGSFSVFFAVFVLVWTVTNFGDAAYVRFAATASPEIARRYLAACTVLKLAVMALVAAAAVPLASVLADQAFGKDALFTPVLMGLLAGASLNLVGLLAATYQAREEFTRYAATNVVPYTLILVCVVALAGADALTLRTAFGAYLGVGVVCLGLSAWRLFAAGASFRVSSEHFSKVLHFAKWYLVANTLFILVQRLDIFFVARYADTEALGTYGAALRITVIATLLTGSISPFLLPSVAKAHRSAKELSDFVRRAGALSVVLIGAVAVLWLVVPILVTLVFGEAYEDAVPIARILLLGTAVLAAYTPISQILLAEERPRGLVYLCLIKLVSLGLLLALWVPSQGPEGAARAVVASEGVTLVYTCVASFAAIGKMRRSLPS
jgi:O-antigen/teichoic acid export membrane protein